MVLKIKEISFSKYMIFYLAIIIVLVYSVIPKIWYSITYKNTKGEALYFEEKPVITIIGEYIKQRPRITFSVNKKQYSFLGNS